jgi:hypothetical protein
MFVCSDCTYPSYLPDCCDNPGCLSNPRANHAALRAMKEEQAKRQAEDEARKAFRASLRRSGFTPTF